MNKLQVRDFKVDFIPHPRVELPSNIISKKLVLEIGCGDGMNSERLSKLYPNHQIIAIERTKIRSQKAMEKNSPNLHIVRADAINWCAHFLKNFQLEHLYIFYPNPEYKNPQKRWARMPYFGFLYQHLKPGGKVYMATNIYDYYTEAKNYFQNYWKLEILKDGVYQGVARTSFEKKYMATQQTCYQLEMLKPSSQTFVASKS
jgi:tRNA G46 methylase TrmB